MERLDFLGFFPRRSANCWSVKVSGFGLCLCGLSLLAGCGDSSATGGKDVRSNRPLKVVCLGDGLTAGVGVAAVEAYPAQLESLLRGAGFEAKVVNAGIKGEAIPAADARVEWILQQRFDVFVLAVGWEDLLLNASSEAARARASSSLLVKIRNAAPEGPLFLLAPPRPEGAEAAHDQFTGHLRELAAEWEHSFLLTGLPSRAEHPEFWLPEQPFPSVTGQKEIARLLLENILAAYD